MSKIILALIAAFAFQSSFAFMEKGEGSSCAKIVDACTAAGFTRGDTGDKRFWMDCMKPVILGKTVSGVKVDPRVVKDCKVHKIQKMKTELRDLQRSI